MTSWYRRVEHYRAALGGNDVPLLSTGSFSSNTALASQSSTSSGSRISSVYEDEIDAAFDLSASQSRRRVLAADNDDELLVLDRSFEPLAPARRLLTSVGANASTPKLPSHASAQHQDARRSPQQSPTKNRSFPTSAISPIQGLESNRRPQHNPSSEDHLHGTMLSTQTRAEVRSVNQLAPISTLLPPVTPPRERSQHTTPRSPPPNYPSPPEYCTPSVVDASMISTLPGSAGTDFSILNESRRSRAQASFLSSSGPNSSSFEDYSLIDVPDNDMAPAYGDDVGFIQGVKRSGHVLCFLFTIVLYASLSLYFTGAIKWLNNESHYFKVMIFTIYSVYIIESLGSNTSSALWQIYKAPDALAHFDKMIDTAPWMKWAMRGYHLRPGLNPDRHKATDRTYTFNKIVPCPIQGCIDETPINFFTSHRLCKYELRKTWRWRDQNSKDRYEGLKKAFVDANNKDDHYTMEESWGIDGFRETLVACRPGTNPPGWASWTVFALMMVLGLSFFYRTFLASRLGSHVIVFKKVLY